MKNLIQYISAYFLCIITFACNNNFLSDVPSTSSLTTASEILISPEMGAKDFFINVAVGDAQYSIVQIPYWLDVQSYSGQFTNNVATINCSVSANPGFSDMGIYKSSMVLDIDGHGRVVIPVSCIIPGNPVISTDNDLALKYNSDNNNFKASLVIKNTGEGILLWSIAKKPDWISFPDSLNNRTFMIAPNRKFVIDLTCSIGSFTSPDMQGQIVIASNDRNNNNLTVNLYFDFTGSNPSLSCSSNQLDFGQTEATQLLDISNQGNGFLTWGIDSYPEWLSVSETSGVMSPYSSKTLVFTCDRSLLPNEQVFQTFYLTTNDVNNLSYAITVTVDNTQIDNPNP